MASRGRTHVAAEPAVALHRGLQRDDPLRPLGCRGTSWASDSSWRSQTVRDTRIPYDLPPMERADLIVVGAGAAGLYAALCAARDGARVALVSARPLAETASYWAQGGLAAALAEDDSPALHLQDTVAAGRGLVRESAARILTEEAPARFRDLEALGVRFDADRHGNLALGLEGGHSRRRVAHAGGSATGRRILRELSAVVAEHARIDVLEGRRAGALRLAGGQVAGLDTDDGRTLAARAVILATGGAAALWSRTTNPPGSFGSGLLLARAAGATLADLELVQFHPTAVTGIPRPRGLPRLRGRARRGRHAARPERRALRRRARAARRGRARHPRGHGRHRRDRTSTSTCATSTRAASPTSSARCARPASTRCASSSPSPPPPTT